MTDRCFYRRALALIFRLKKNFNLIQWVVRASALIFQPVQNLPTAVLGAIVDQNDFLSHLHGAHTANHFLKRALFVVDGNQDGELHCSNSRFLSSRTKAESFGSAFTASLILA